MLPAAQLEARLPTGTVTFMFSDMEGSTRLLRQLGDRYPGLLAEHHRLLAEAVEPQGGVRVGSEGDSLFAAFASAPRAVAAVVNAQRALAAQEWPDGVQVRCRMGIHTGEGTVSNGTYVGLDVHRAARVAAAAHGGQVLLTAATAALVEQSLPGDVELRDAGRHRLKDLAQPEELYQLVIEGLPAEFPPLRTLDATPNNLPTQLTTFVGRAREVAEVAALVRAHRLVTLTGPGGTGKSRLALQVAAELSLDFPDGLYFVALASIDDPDLVASTIVQSIGLQHSSQTPPAEQLADYLREKRLLLVLDNFEQVVSAAPLVGELLRAAPAVRAIVTSRAALQVYGEQEYPVPPLGLPDPANADPISLTQYEAVTLFIERALAVKPDFQVTNANAPAVAEICARLDGLPLAIELAAARVKLLPPQALLARLGRSLDTVVGGSRDLPARQQTLRGAIAWSYDLLEPASKRLFARFSVFVAGATLEAAEEVCGTGLDVDVLDGLAGLVNQSLLRQDEIDGEPRFWMLGTIREFGREQLAASDEGDAILARYADVFLALAERAAPELTRPDQKRWLDLLARENGNLRGALSWAIETGRARIALRFVFALWRFWHMRGLVIEGADWASRAIELPHARDHPLELARGIEAAGGIAYWRGDMAQAQRHYDSFLEHARRIGDQKLIADALYDASFPQIISREYPLSTLTMLDESLAIYRTLDEREGVTKSLWAMGNAHYFGGKPEQARDILLEDIALLRDTDRQFDLAWALHTLGLAYNALGRSDLARPPWQEALQVFSASNDVSGITLLLGDFALLAAAEGDAERAVRVAAAAQRIANVNGVDLATVVSEIERRDLKGVWPDDATVDALTAEGRAMTLEQAIDYALGREDRGEAA